MRKIITSILTLALTFSAQAEPDSFGLGNGRSGAGSATARNTVANDYAAITATLHPGDTAIQVGGGAGIRFRPGSLVMVIQMESTAPSPTPGDPGPFDVSTSTTGVYELGRVQTALGGVITLSAPLTRVFTSPGAQVVYVPELTTLSVAANASVIAPPWDGSTGGVLALLVRGALQNDGDLLATGAGARGGTALFDSASNYGCTDYNEPTPAGAERGEGIVVQRYGSTNTGRSSDANGGGGGVCRGGGGGGGGNAGHGGRGGRTAGDDGSRNYRSFGGGILSYSVLGRLTFGGGGGAGHSDDQNTLHHGAQGGGVIFIRAASINGTGHIRADGASVASGELAGQGGGGAGGTIIIRTTGAVACSGLSARGGNGGALTDLDETFGPGGGGGGGRVMIQAANVGAACMPAVNGGLAGTISISSSFGPAYGATDGDPGVVETPPAGPYVVLAAPTITAPIDQSNVAPNPSVSGHAHPNLGVRLRVDGQLLADLTTNAAGDFSTVTHGLALGAHVLTAVERAAGAEGPVTTVHFTIEDPNADPDADGLSNSREHTLGTDPADPDTDHDGIRDGDELTRGTSPLDADTDDDGISDGEEIIAGTDHLITNPLQKDTDGDGLSDGLETSAHPVPAGHSTGPLHLAFAGTSTTFVADADPSTHTDPTRADSDGGSARDGEEDLNHNGRVDPGERDPNLAGDDILTTCGNGALDAGEACDDHNQSVGDGCSAGCAIETGWVCRGTPSVCSGPEEDPDQDQAVNREELQAGSDPFVADTDLDGLLDGAEIHGNTSPIDADTDDDGLSDGEELTPGTDGLVTDPRNPDTDGDGLSDGLEESELPIADHVTSSGIHVLGTALSFVPDADMSTHTDPTKVDTDNGGTSDGVEDQNHNGRLDPGETDPLSAGDDVAIDPCVALGTCDAGVSIDAALPDAAETADAGTSADAGVSADAGSEAPDAGHIAIDCDDPADCPDLYTFPTDARLGGGSGCNCESTRGSPGFEAFLALFGLLVLWGLRRRSLGLLLLALVLGAALPRPSLAQTPVETGDLPAQRFRWAGTSEGILDVEWAGTRPDRLFAASLLFDYARSPLFIREVGPDGSTLASGPLLRSLFTADVALMTTIVPAVELQAGFSVILFQERPDALSFAGGTTDLTALSGFGFGDVWIAAKLRLLNRHDHGLDLALVPRVTFPTAGSADYRGEAGVTIVPELALSRAFGPLRLAFNGGVRVRPTGVQFLGLNVSHELTYRLGAGIRPTKWFEFDAGLSGNTSLTSPFGDREPSPMELLFALRFTPTKPLDITLGGGFGLRGGFGAPDARIIAGLRFNVFASRDRDGDGLADDEDRCPKEKGPRENQGCPVVEAPKPVVIVDRDGDGIKDKVDQCPDEKEDFDGFEDTDGCPDPDNDKDGLADVADQCPNQAGPVENQGCPEADADGDGVIDRLDNCPSEPGPAENHGCMAKQMVTIGKTKLEISEKVFFKTGSAEIEARSFALLKNIASVLSAHPEIKKLRIEGHTDDRGKKAANEKLSDRRANSVMSFLLRQGVEAPRLTAMGFGPRIPIADNTTEDGRSQNRRVEFVIVGESD